MLVQSQNGEIELLPALPQTWLAGKISGLRARGGYEVSLTWSAGTLATATIKNVSGDGNCRVRYGTKTVVLAVQRGAEKKLNAGLESIP